MASANVDAPVGITKYSYWFERGEKVLIMRGISSVTFTFSIKECGDDDEKKILYLKR
jgi:hypothetical protein